MSKAAIADVTPKGVWTDEQRRSLKAAFTSLGEVLDGLILLKGVVSTQTLAMGGLPLPMTISGTTKPAAIVVLSATKVSDGSVISMPPILWTYTPSTSENAIQITDIDVDDGEDYELTVLTVETAT